jgi:hypothetical protein
MNNSTLFEDSFEFEKYQSKGIAEVRRRFKEELPSGNQQYITSKDSAIVVAKGISAFLSIEQYLTYPSLRLILRNNDILDIENIFTYYFEHCLKFLQNEENKKLFKNERRSRVELVNQHCKEEEQSFTDSKQLFNQVRSSEINVIEQIKKASIYYPEWVKNTHLKVEFHEMNSELVNESIKKKTKPGRKPSSALPVEQFIVGMDNKYKDGFLSALKRDISCNEPVELVFMLRALDKLGYISFARRRQLFLSFLSFYGKNPDFVSVSGQNDNWNRTNKELLDRMTRLISNIIDQNNIH